MKRILSFIAAVMFAGQAWAATTFTVDGLKYTITDEANHYVSVGKGSTNPTGALNIQEKVTNPNDGKEYTVTSIARSAFSRCSGLTSVTIPESVTSIGETAFCVCSVLTSVTIPNAVTSIGDNAFSACYKLTEINVESGNASYTSENGVLFNKAKTTLIRYPADKTETTYTIPNSVTNICSEAFGDCNTLTSVTIPNSVTSIGSSAFARSYKLSVTIPNSVTSIGYDAFREIKTIIYSGNVSGKPWGARTYGIVADEDGFVYYDIKKTKLVAYIGNASSITIPNSVTSISFYAFYGCSKLTDINVESANTAYTSENGVLFNKAETTLICYPAGKTETTYTIPNSVTSIGNYAFHSSKLTSVTISNSVTSIGQSAFAGCSGLTSICYEGSGVPTYQSNSFNSVDKTIPVCVPADYTSNSWCGFTNLYKGHDIVTDPATVTCTEAGLTEGYHCSKCGRVFVAQEEVAALGHTEVADVAIEPTCTEPGKTAGKHCSVCNAILEGLEVILATGHTYSSTITAPTCTEVGYTTHTCSVCDYTYNSDTVAANGHTYSTTITAPTCTAVGYTTHTCSVCEYTYYSDTVDAKGHKADSVEFENIVPATCTAAGTKDSVVFCSVCQVELSREERAIPALGHSYSNTITAPTCTAVGYTTHTCSVCENTYYSDTIAAKGHKADSVEFENIIPAICTAAGSKDSVVFCSVCEVEISREERAIPALGHTEVIDAAIAATCTATGKTEGKHCSVCNVVLVPQEEIAALGHEFKDYVYNNDATTAADGTETATCTRGCGATDTRIAAGTKLAETPEKGTAVSDAAASTMNIYAHHNTIVIENATDEISVYNAMGTLICRDATPCVRAEINVNVLGVYIVKTGNVVKRVMVNQ